MNTRNAGLWGLGIIFAANFLNYLDRQLVSALEDPIRRELNLDGLEYGLLWTLFTVGYMLYSMPIGLWADRSSRTKIFAGCVVVWSIATIVSGLAQEKYLLGAARLFIGVGEAGCLVIGPSLISDLFSKEVRGRALSVFFLAMPLGGTMAFLMAGLLFGMGWRNMFFLAGAPGFLIAVLIWLMPDPPRGGTESAGGHGMHGGGSFQEYLQLLRNPTLLLVILAQAFAVILLIPLVHFGVKFFVDTRGMSEESARVSLGIMALIGGVLGSSLSGFLGDLLSRRTKGAYALLAGISYLLGWPCVLLGFFSESPWVFLPALTGGCFFLFLCMPAVNTQIANVVNPMQRSTAWALAVFVLHFLGDMLSPPVFGKISDSIGRQQTYFYFSFGLVGAGLCCLIAACTASRDIARVERQIAEQQGPVLHGLAVET